MGASSPTQRSLKQLRERGLVCEVVEHWNQWSRRRQDLFGVFDILGIGPGLILAVQTTTKANLSARRKKMLAEPNVRSWLEAGGKIELHGWFKQGRRWQVKVEGMTLGDEPEASATEPTAAPAAAHKFGDFVIPDGAVLRSGNVGIEARGN